MKTAPPRHLRVAQLAARIGGGALLIAALAIWREPASLAPAWRCAVFACVGPALGSLVFVLIHSLTGGTWGQALRPSLLAGSRLLPWVWLLIVPLAMAAVPASGLADWRFASPLAIAIRVACYGLAFFLLAMGAVRAWPREGRTTRLSWVGPVGLIGVLFMTHLLATDWLAALEPQWVSTAFPAVWLIGQAVAGLAAAILVALLDGAEPSHPFAPGRSLGLDWGTLLFATAMLWCYVAFAQYLIIWSGNLPAETSWYMRRLDGAWRFVPLALLLLHFVAPLFVLLSRRAKQDRRALGFVAATLLIAQSLQTVWMILPAFPESASAPWTALILTVGLGGLGMNRYLLLAREETKA